MSKQSFFDFRGLMPVHKTEDQAKTEKILRQAQDDEREGPAFVPDVKILEKMTAQKIKNMRELERIPLKPRTLYRPKRQ